RTYRGHVAVLFCGPASSPDAYTSSLHAALPISGRRTGWPAGGLPADVLDPCYWRVDGDGHPDPLQEPERRASNTGREHLPVVRPDRKSTRLNSSHSQNSYAVFCLKKKKK